MADNGLIRKLWTWFDNYFLLLATALLLIIVPLYPKIPLADIIPGYIVRLRLEDIVIATVIGWWVIQLLRKKVTWKTPLSIFILAYLATGLVSNLLGVVLTKTIPTESIHIAKSMLHWLRHIQYLSLFFIAYNAVKNRKQGLFLLLVTLGTLVGVVIYGYGQKYHYWPVYSTMNREFSKGVKLYLSEHARVQSTFAGHYDLGAYLVVILPLALVSALVLSQKDSLKSVFFQTKLGKIVRQVLIAGSWFAWFGGLWLLVLSASRTSYGGYLLAIGLVFLLFIKIKGWWFSISRGAVVFLISGLMMIFVGDLSSRFSQVIDTERYPLAGQVFKIAENLKEDPFKFVGQVSRPPENSISTDQLEEELKKQGMTRSDTQPSTSKPKDVYVDVPEKEFELADPAATLAGELRQVGDKLVQDRIFSDCALKHSLSVCIRLETLWPQAFQGWLANPLFGSGYATLTKSSVEQFTEAESTDNNFLRTLGENGSIGFFFFYGTIGLSLWYSWLVYRQSQDRWLTGLAVANFAGTIGLLLNAVYIDVFVASKVAYTFWLLQGIFLAIFVKEGIVAPQFNFQGQRQKSDTQRLKTLLQTVESNTNQKLSGSKYLSSSKRRRKSSKDKKRKIIRRTK
jgi:hypothetical protein